QGWIEVPYLSCPVDCGAVSSALGRLTLADGGIVHIVPGLSIEPPDRVPDVLRGEETQVFGTVRDADTATIILPGTHSKWVSLVDSVVESFQTYMSGEVFSLLAEQSVLRHSVALEAWDDAAFLQAVNEAVKHPAGFLNACFGLRAKGLLHQADSAKLSASLSGWVIGCELASTKNFWRNHTVAVVGAEALAKRYREAIQSLGGVAVCHDPDQTTLAGLRQIAEELNPVFAQRKKHE
ncbi:MAG: 2-dehydro-3-deoxygalactonokinase, partial [Granulosicoccaceae bacterium]